MSTIRRVALATALLAIVIPAATSAQTLLASGLQGAQGSTIGPDHALYVTEGAIGRVSRIDPTTGEVTPFWDGLPPSIIGIGGVVDVVFRGQTAYALVTLVGPDVGGTDIVGIYRREGPDSSSVFADIGAFNLANPPATDFFVPTGVQYALETYRGKFLVSDGHHNRVLQVGFDGGVSELITFDNIVPTGLETRGWLVYMAELGPAPNLPEDGKVVAFNGRWDTPWELASGAPMMVDVEFGRWFTLYGLSQGTWDGVEPGSPALPNTGSLVRIRHDGSLDEIVGGLDRPTSLEIMDRRAFVVSLTGDVWVVDNVSF